MEQESHFRSAMFGFNKEDVNEYIENLLNQIILLQSEQQQRGRELPSLKEQIETLTLELEQVRVRENAFLDTIEENQRQIHDLELERDDLQKSKLEADARLDQVKDVKGQVGTIIFDALEYSEKIIARAKETASIIARRAQTTVRESATDVDGIGEDVTRISQDFSESLSQLVGRIKNVSADLSGMANMLEPDLTDGSEQYTFDAQGLPVLKEQEAKPEESAQEAEEEHDTAKPNKDWFANAPIKEHVEQAPEAQDWTFDD